MRITLIELAHYNAIKESVREFFNGRRDDKVKTLLHKCQVLYNLRMSEVQSTELKGVKNGQRTRNI